MKPEPAFDEGPFPPLVRVFIAIAVPAPQQVLAQSIISDLNKSQAKVTWVKPEALHLTLKFLGEIPRDDVANLCNTFDNVLVNIPDFEITFKGLGQFPQNGIPRVIWLGIEQGGKELSALARTIDDAVIKLGFAGESRPWQPHLTLGRVHSSYHKEELLLLINQTLATNFPAFPATAVHLMRSQLQRSGPIYTKLGSWELIRHG